MKLRTQVLDILGALVVLAGWQAMPAMATPTTTSCERCGTGCPANFETFCSSIGCVAGPNTTCEYETCAGIDGMDYKYHVTCAC